MSYVLDIRELVHKLPFHHFSSHELKSSAVFIGLTYATPCLVLIAVCALYFKSYTLRNNRVFENVNVKEHKTRAIVTACIVLAFGPASSVSFTFGFRGGLNTLKIIQAWAEEAQRGARKIGLTMMGMDDALTKLKAEATAATDVVATATVNTALSAVATALVNDGGAAEFVDDLNYFRWVKEFKIFTILSMVSFLVAIVLLIISAVLPIMALSEKRPAHTWWKTKRGSKSLTPDLFVRGFPLVSLMFLFTVCAIYWPIAVLGAEVCFAYEGMVEFQVPENLQLYMVCPRFGYELGEYLQNMHADQTKLNSAVANVEALTGTYASSANMAALKLAKKTYEANVAQIFEGLGDCQPMSDTIELATAQVCNEVVLSLQMVVAITFLLSLFLMYSTMHQWFGSDVAKELAGDEEESLFSKLTSEDKLSAKSKFGQKKKTDGHEKKDKKDKKDKKKKRRTSGGSSMEGLPGGASATGSVAATPQAQSTEAMPSRSAEKVGTTESDDRVEEYDVRAPLLAESDERADDKEFANEEATTSTSESDSSVSEEDEEEGVGPSAQPAEIELKDVMNDDAEDANTPVTLPSERNAHSSPPLTEPEPERPSSPKTMDKDFADE